MSTLHNLSLYSPAFDNFEAVMNHYSPLVSKTNQEGLALLQEAKAALEYYEAMPEQLTYRQAQDAANALRKPNGIIGALESSFVDVFKSFTSHLPSSYDEKLEPEKAEYIYQEAIDRAENVIKYNKSLLSSLPKRLSN
ncbi:hypothetical protein MUN81_22550 (plasmid) [Hymenobacter sp. 5317J-9]|uniref:hypothetical protein n=1 Tax=Hymenobacter sp. 5317J-9 TaxID=2932250 RepID=UPI001FD67F39|nr:hypothetical protein [Hymenobacter sp. 5317J-9]UOR00224.1 hypothetical protein MUN81_22550 [Hymenobacter sp. 5317J-9]